MVVAAERARKLVSATARESPGCQHDLHVEHRDSDNEGEGDKSQKGETPNANTRGEEAAWLVRSLISYGAQMRALGTCSNQLLLIDASGLGMTFL